MTPAGYDPPACRCRVPKAVEMREERYDATGDEPVEYYVSTYCAKCDGELEPWEPVLSGDTTTTDGVVRAGR